MKLGFTKKVNILIGSALVAGPALAAAVVLAPGLLAKPAIVIGVAAVIELVFVAGCCAFAAGKGYSPALGLLGLLYVPGLIVLAFFPDKHKGEDPSSGCLPAILVIVLMIVLVFVPLVFLGTRMAPPQGGNAGGPGANVGRQGRPGGQPGQARNQRRLRVVIGTGEHKNGMVGTLFIQTGGDYKPDRVIRIREKGWALGDPGADGKFDNIVARGAITPEGELAGLPDDVIPNAKTIWVAGDMEAFLGKQQLRTPKHLQKK